MLLRVSVNLSQSACWKLNFLVVLGIKIGELEMCRMMGMWSDPTGGPGVMWC